MKKSITQLKEAFGDFRRPTSGNFGDVFDSFVHKDERLTVDQMPELLITEIKSKINSAQFDQPNGVPRLDENGLLPRSVAPYSNRSLLQSKLSFSGGNADVLDCSFDKSKMPNDILIFFLIIGNNSLVAEAKPNLQVWIDDVLAIEQEILLSNIFNFKIDGGITLSPNMDFCSVFSHYFPNNDIQIASELGLNQEDQYMRVSIRLQSYQEDLDLKISNCIIYSK